MALVFISHAHGDGALARKLVALLRDGVRLEPDHFFVSSQGGRGVAPAGKIREEILERLAAAPALVVLVTPRSVGSPWLWLEAGNRLGSSEKSSPIFAVPSGRWVPLLTPVSDLKCICLDQEDDLHELVKAVGQCVQRPIGEALTYRASLEEVASAARRAYSPLSEHAGRLALSIRAHPVALLVASVAVAAALFYAASVATRARASAGVAQSRVVELEGRLAEAMTAADEAVNAEVLRTASRYLVLKGVVLSGANPVPGADVVASFDSSNTPDCARVECARDTTTSEGEFRLDLTRIKAQTGDDIRLTVSAGGFQSFSRLVRVDVRVIEQGVGQRLTLTRKQ